LDSISKRNSGKKPQFLKQFDDKETERKLRYIKDKKERAEKRTELKKGDDHYSSYNTAMQHVFSAAKSIDYRNGKPKETTYLQITDMIKKPPFPGTSTVYSQKNKLVELCDKYKSELDALYKELREADEDEKETVYSEIRKKKDERNEIIKNKLTSEYLLYLLLEHYEKDGCENWHIFAPILNNEMFKHMLSESKEKLMTVVQDDGGEYTLYGKKYAKKC
jgi:hypothetical protein